MGLVINLWGYLSTCGVSYQPMGLVIDYEISYGLLLQSDLFNIFTNHLYRLFHIANTCLVDILLEGLQNQHLLC